MNLGQRLWPDILRATSGLQLPRRLSERLLRRPGPSGEFAELRAYVAGDDVRRLDWRAYARSDRLCVRLFDPETPPHLWVVLDRSASMAYAERAPQSKFAVGQALALALAWLALRRGEAAGLLLAGTPAPAPLLPRPERAYWPLWAQALQAAAPAGPTCLRPAGLRLLRAAAARSWVFVLSDLFDVDPQALQPYRALAQRGCAVCVGQLLDPRERDVDWSQPVELQGMEDGGRLRLDPGPQAAAYGGAMRAALARRQQALRAAGIACVSLPTDAGLRDLLATLLLGREQTQQA